MHEQKIQVLRGTVSKLLRRGATANLKNALNKIHPADIAHLFRYFEPEEQQTLLKQISNPARAADVISELEGDKSAGLVMTPDNELLGEIVQQTADKQSAVVIRSLPDELAEQLL